MSKTALRWRIEPKEDVDALGESPAIREAARMLREGYTYNQIEVETGASTATISRVKRCLHYGMNGYELVLDRLREEETESE